MDTKLSEISVSFHTHPPLVKSLQNVVHGSTEPAKVDKVEKMPKRQFIKKTLGPKLKIQPQCGSVATGLAILSQSAQQEKPLAVDAKRKDTRKKCVVLSRI